MVKRIVEGIAVWLETDYLKAKQELNSLAIKILYTDPIDACFDYTLGAFGIQDCPF